MDTANRLVQENPELLYNRIPPGSVAPSCISEPPVLSPQLAVLRQHQTDVFLFLFSFLGPHLQHMEVPRLGVELELQLPAYTTATATPKLTYTTACGNDGSLTYRVRPGIEPRPHGY